MRARVVVPVLAVATGLLCCSAAFGTSAPVKGNSSYGVGTGSGSWNLTPGGSSTTTVDGVTIDEQTVCPTVMDGVCPSGDDFTYVFQIDSSISDPQVALSGLSGATDFGVMACTETSGNTPGPLCTDSALLTALGCSTTTCTGVTYDGTDPVFTVTGDVDGDGLTFYVTQSGATPPSLCIDSVCTASTSVPEPNSLGLLSAGAGLLTLWWRRRANAQA